MDLMILIDGYNVIRNVPPLAREEQREFSQGRQRLLEWLSAYRRKHPGTLIVVFDGGKGGGYGEENDLFQGIRIIYSRLGQTADDIIKRMIGNNPEKSLVVSSDRDLADFCRARGAGVIGSREFASRIQARLDGFGDQDEEEAPGASRRSRKKKGRARRPSKKQKKEMKYWEKI